ncbi:hypothetical protein TWF281_007935 [Arthrobotrys megalospora]
MAGRHFRRLKGLELTFQTKPSKNATSPQITAPDISYLYKTLGRVAKMCDEDFEYGPRLNGGSAVDSYTFQQLSPLFFTGLCIKQDRMTDFSDWSQTSTIPRLDLADLFEYGGETTLHAAAAAYFGDKTAAGTEDEFFQAVTHIKRHHVDFISHAASNLSNDILLHMAILLRHSPTFKYIFDLYHKFRVSKSPLEVTGYRLNLPGPQGPEILTKLPLTAFMVAITCPDKTFINRFLHPKILPLWIGPSTTARLSSALEMPFAQDENVKDIMVQPIHLAGLTKQNDLFRTLFKYHRKDYYAIWPVAIAAVHNDDSSLFPLLTELFDGSSLVQYPGSYRLLTFVKRYGSQRLVNDLLEFFDSRESLASFRFRDLAADLPYFSLGASDINGPHLLSFSGQMSSPGERISDQEIFTALEKYWRQQFTEG